MGLPEDYTQKLLATVSNTTADECLKIAQRQVHAEELVIVVVGPASKLQAGFEAIAPVTVVK